MTPEQRQKAAEFIKGVNIPYRVFSTEDKLFMVFVFDNSKAIGIFSNDGPTDQDDFGGIYIMNWERSSSGAYSFIRTPLTSAIYA